MRTYLRPHRLVVALWNPVEAADGKVLETRRREGDVYVETWRPEAPADGVTLPVQIQVHGVQAADVTRLATVDLMTGTLTPLRFDGEGRSIVTDRVGVGPLPAVVVLDLK